MPQWHCNVMSDYTLLPLHNIQYIGYVLQKKVVNIKKNIKIFKNVQKGILIFRTLEVEFN